MFLRLLASPKYGLLHTPDMPTPWEEHLRRRLGTLSVSLACSSLLFNGYLPDITRMRVNDGADQQYHGRPFIRVTDRSSEFVQLLELLADYIARRGLN